MTKFESFIVENGYTKLDNNLSNVSVYQDSNGRLIRFGLSEASKPPTLLSPRPNILYSINIDGIAHIYQKSYDIAINSILQQKDFGDILDAMFDKNKVLFCGDSLPELLTWDNCIIHL